ncbi:cutinase [Xylaria digitata]|nr:cutinase [Xylaria digitata]
MPHFNITHPSEAGACSRFKILDARGTQERQGTTLQKLLGGISLPVEYPAGVDQNTASGLRDCPDQEYALFGYSQGATLMLRALNRLNCEALDAVSSVTLFGNPYRLPGKPSSVNGNGQPGNNATVGLFVNSAIANNQTIPQLSRSLDQSGKVLDYCLEGDGVCVPNPACSCQLPAGHLSYGLVASVHDTVVEHVVSRF